MAISDIQREDDPKLDQGFAWRRHSSDRPELCSRPRQREGARAGEAGVVGRSMGPFGEVSLGFERMISISGCFYGQGDSTGLVVICRIAFVHSMVPQAETTLSIRAVSDSFYQL